MSRRLFVTLGGLIALADADASAILSAASRRIASRRTIHRHHQQPLEYKMLPFFVCRPLALRDAMLIYYYISNDA